MNQTKKMMTKIEALKQQTGELNLSVMLTLNAGRECLYQGCGSSRIFFAFASSSV